MSISPSVPLESAQLITRVNMHAGTTSGKHAALSSEYSVPERETYASPGCVLTYESVKAPLQKAYKFVPEAYPQWFISWERRANQSYMEFVRELTNHGNRWCLASSVDNLRHCVIWSSRSSLNLSLLHILISIKLQLLFRL